MDRPPGNAARNQRLVSTPKRDHHHQHHHQHHHHDHQHENSSPTLVLDGHVMVPKTPLSSRSKIPVPITPDTAPLTPISLQSSLWSHQSSSRLGSPSKSPYPGTMSPGKHNHAIEEEAELMAILKAADRRTNPSLSSMEESLRNLGSQTSFTIELEESFGTLSNNDSKAQGDDWWQTPMESEDRRESRLQKALHKKTSPKRNQRSLQQEIPCHEQHRAYERDATSSTDEMTLDTMDAVASQSVQQHRKATSPPKIRRSSLSMQPRRRTVSMEEMTLDTVRAVAPPGPTQVVDHQVERCHGSKHPRAPLEMSQPRSHQQHDQTDHPPYAGKTHSTRSARTVSRRNVSDNVPSSPTRRQSRLSIEGRKEQVLNPDPTEKSPARSSANSRNLANHTHTHAASRPMDELTSVDAVVDSLAVLRDRHPSKVRPRCRSQAPTSRVPTPMAISHEKSTASPRNARHSIRSTRTSVTRGHSQDRRRSRSRSCNKKQVENNDGQPQHGEGEKVNENGHELEARRNADEPAHEQVPSYKPIVETAAEKEADPLSLPSRSPGRRRARRSSSSCRSLCGDIRVDPTSPVKHQMSDKSFPNVSPTSSLPASCSRAPTAFRRRRRSISSEDIQSVGDLYRGGRALEGRSKQETSQYVPTPTSLEELGFTAEQFRRLKAAGFKIVPDT